MYGYVMIYITLYPRIDINIHQEVNNLNTKRVGGFTINIKARQTRRVVILDALFSTKCFEICVRVSLAVMKLIHGKL